jgi:type I restriction enzyme S subunit
MNPELLIAHFNRISDAPDAIPHLRRFILDLAVRGKLVEQNTHDEPASELLQRIEAEKARLVKAGEIKKGRPSSLIQRDEAPFSLPAGWEWTRIRQVTSDRGQTTPNKSFTYIDVTAIDKEIGCIANAKVLVPADAPSRARKLVQTGDVLYSCVRPYLLNVAVIQNKIIPAPIASTAFAVLNGFGLVLSKYLWILLRSPFMVECVETKMRGQAYPAINDSDFANLPLPLPPLAEQHRIVTKVDELMALCTQLGIAQAERETRRDLLAEAALHHLKNGANAKASRGYARFCLDHLPRLIIRPEQLAAVRQAILDLAVRGRLVPQNPTDEPAADLFKRIQTKKAQLSKDGVLKKDKTAWEGLPKEPPYELPANWIWTHLQDVFEISRGGSPRPAGDPRYFGGPIPWITVGEITKDRQKYLIETENGLTEEGSVRSRFISVGDLLLTNSGATLGVPKISHIKACINDGVAVLRLFHEVPLNNFAYLYLHSQTEAFRKINQGMGQPNLNTPIIAGWFFPLPPLAEQLRIVAKVDELMQLCDRLEEQLTTTQSEKHGLLVAVLHDALKLKLLDLRAKPIYDGRREDS